ncbi:hypothetical protein AB1M95_15590 [Sulfitobacter sp. LCG007]
MSFALAACLSFPLSAQEDRAPSLMERGADMFLQGLMDEMGPAIKGMKEFVDQMGPAFKDMMAEVEDWSAYEAPEMLPNGDIIIRRKEPRDPDETPPAGTDGPQPGGPQIEL